MGHKDILRDTFTQIVLLFQKQKYVQFARKINMAKNKY